MEGIGFEDGGGEEEGWSGLGLDGAGDRVWSEGRIRVDVGLLGCS